MSETRDRPNLRGKDVKRMDCSSLYTCRDVVFTCSNGWTIERVSEEDQGVEGFLMGHCLGDPKHGCAVKKYTGVYSLREPDGTPHATVIVVRDTGGTAVGRGNRKPKDAYMRLLREWREDVWGQNPTQYQLDYRRPEGETLEGMS